VLHQARSTLQVLCTPAVVAPKTSLTDMRHFDGEMPRLPAKRARRLEKLPLELAMNVNQPSNNHDLYSEFKRKLVLDGIVSWRVHSADEDVLAMNDYDVETGEFMPSSFVHVCRKIVSGDIMYECSCSMFRWIHATVTSAKADIHSVWVGIEGNSCMHCRFIAEELEPRLTDLLQIQADTGMHGCEVDKIHHKLLTAKQWFNVGVVLMSSPSAATLKFSVCSSSCTNVNASFVHLSKDGLFIRCQSGECQASQGAKKKPQFLLSSSTCGLLCCHLEVMRANQEQWQHLFVQQTTTVSVDITGNYNAEVNDDEYVGLDADEIEGSVELEEHSTEGQENDASVVVSSCVYITN
jgi:hypothetical protein